MPATSIPLGFLGNSATFTPAMNNIQGWFDRRRSIAVSLISVGPAVSGFIWPQIYRWLLPDVGWRETLVIYGVMAGTLLFLCAFYVRPSPIAHRAGKRAAEDLSVLPMPSPVLMALLSAAGFCCCAAMAVPFVHMVAFCGDLGFAAGARLGGDVADPADRGRRDLRHGPAVRLYRPDQGQPALRRSSRSPRWWASCSSKACRASTRCR